MDLCGEAEDKLAYDQSQHEVEIQRDILDPLNQLAEVSPVDDVLKRHTALLLELSVPNTSFFPPRWTFPTY